MSSVSNRTHNVVCRNAADGIFRIRQTFGTQAEGLVLEILWTRAMAGDVASVSFWDSALVCMVTLVPNRTLLAEISHGNATQDGILADGREAKRTYFK